MAIATKLKILESSIRLFNENGLANVRLQQIADETGISVGNLAYHFKNKDAIVSFVYESLFDELGAILSGYMGNPDFTDFDQQIGQYFSFFHKYHFYLIDLFEIDRSFPEIRTQWRNHVTKMHLQIRSRIDFYQQKGLVVTEPHEGIFDLLTNNLWMSIVFWIPQQVLKGQMVAPHYFKEAVWSQLLPYLTPKGLDAYFTLIHPILRDLDNN
jgi:AcrR family transcriptional regulator